MPDEKDLMLHALERESAQKAKMVVTDKIKSSTDFGDETPDSKYQLAEQDSLLSLGQTYDTASNSFIHVTDFAGN